MIEAAALDSVENKKGSPTFKTEAKGLLLSCLVAATLKWTKTSFIRLGGLHGGSARW